MYVFVPDYQTPERMALKRQAVPLPDFSGKRVLDVGCDHGYWSFLAAENGASLVVGLDRNRHVRGRGFANLIAQNQAIANADNRFRTCSFRRFEAGKCWQTFGTFDLIFVMSVYHHIYENCGDHGAVWFWLAQHCDQVGEVIFEGPLDDRDPVVVANVSDVNRRAFESKEILAAAAHYFEPEYIGPALHEPTREVWRFVKPLHHRARFTLATMTNGAGGATAAFQYADCRRIKEIEATLGFAPFAGSLNLTLDTPFDWDVGYYRAQILDVTDRSLGLASDWSPRWARFYPLTIDGVDACAFRFEGEKYGPRFMELISPQRLRDAVKGQDVTIAR